MEETAHPLVESLKDYLRDKRMLLLLDNFEQVITAASLVADLQANCPELKILVTSRAPLRIRGEYEFFVPPLAAPNPNKMPILEKLLDYDAVALFVQRAQSIRTDFAVTNENARAVAEICHRLDGLPLALELAAARVRILSPETMLKRLESRLGLLTNGPRDLPARQRTLRDTIAWSYDLLDPDDRKLFTRLSVFVGGFSYEAAETICNAPRDIAPAILEGLSRLVERSLLRREDISDELRFRTLETIREFAFESLVASGESKVIKENHADFFLSFAEKAELELKGPEQAAWLIRLDSDHENLRAALRWSIENEPELSLRFGGALWWYWFFRGHLTEGRIWLTTILAHARSAPYKLRAKALSGAGVLAVAQDDFPAAQSSLNESLALYRELGDKEGTAFVLNYLGRIARDEGDFEEGYRLHEESLALYQELGNKPGIAMVLNNLGVAARNQGDYDKASTLHTQSLQLFRDLGDKRAIARSLINLGIIFERKGDYNAACKLLNESLSLSQELGEKVGISESQCLLGTVARKQGNHDSAGKLLGNSLALSLELGYKDVIAKCLEEFAGCACSQGQAERAARLFGTAEALREAARLPIPPAYRTDTQGDLATARHLLGEQRFIAEWSQGRAMTLENAITYALGAPENHRKSA
jgi:predicted ATPase